MMSFCKGVASSRKMPRVPRDVDSTESVDKGLTTPFQNVTINPNRGDKETRLEFQPHLNSGLWRIYIDNYDDFCAPTGRAGKTRG